MNGHPRILAALSQGVKYEVRWFSQPAWALWWEERFLFPSRTEQLFLCRPSPTLSLHQLSYPSNYNLIILLSSKLVNVLHYLPQYPVIKIFSKIFVVGICSSLKQRPILYLTNVHFTFPQFHPRRGSPSYSLSTVLTGPKTQSKRF